jgi:TonB family protein
MNTRARRISFFLLLAISIVLSSVAAGAMPIQPPGGVNPILPAGQSSGQSSATEPSQATPDADGTYHIGHGVRPPRVITAVDPEYTDLARKKKLSGICVVGLVVDAQGNPRNIRVVRSIAKDLDPSLKKAADGLDQNAINAVSKYRFSPAEYQGKPVPVQVNIEVSFRTF